MSARTISLAVVSAFAFLVALGCDPQAKDKQITFLTRDRDELLRQKTELTKEIETARMQYAKAIEAMDAKEVELKAARARAIELEGMIGQQTAAGGNTTGRTYREPTDSGPTRVRSARGGRQVIGEVAGDVLFGPGQASLTQTRSAELDRIVATIKSKHRGARIQVIGHSDGDPINKSRNKWKDNYELSTARANAVKQYLVSHGIAAGDIETQGIGFDRPLISPEKSKNDKAKNRRVEIAIQ